MRSRTRPAGPRRRGCGRCVAVALALTPVAGCTIHERARQDIAAALAAWERRQVAAAALAPAEPAGRPAPPASQPGTPPAEGSPPATPPATLPGDPELRAYIREALERNPAVRAAAAEVQAKLARIPQATALPDPMVRMATGPEPVQTAVGDMMFSLDVGQTFPLPAKLERAGRAAAAEVRMAVAALNAARLEVVAEVERAYAALYLMDRYVELTGANAALLGDLEQVVRAQYEVGQKPQQDVLRVQTALAELRDEERRYRLQRAAAAARLNELRDRPPAAEVAPTAARSAEVLALDTAALLRLAEEHNPLLAGLRAQAERDQEQVALAGLGYWPDVTLGFGWNYLRGRDAFRPPPNPQTGMMPPVNRASEVGDDNWAISVQLNIPIWVERIAAARREARSRLLRTQRELQAARNRIAFRVVDAWTRMEMQQRTVALLDTTLLPQARQTYAVTLAAYQAGTTDFLDVIDSWRRWLDYALMMQRELVDLETSLSDLQREIGLELARGAQPPAGLPEGSHP